MPVSTQCPVCGHETTTLLRDGDDSLNPDSVGSSRTRLSPGRILRCEKCGLAFRSLRPTPAELALLYRAADDRVYEAELPNRLKTAKRHRRIVERHRSRPGIVVDIGSASGLFLRTMADVGWTGVGVEPSASQCARARQLLSDRVEIKQTVLENADIQTKADLVTLWDVLEHVTDPVGFLQLSAALLKNDGLLVLNVPRIDSFAAKHLGERWPLLLAEHLNYFTPESLRICARRAGLNVITFGSRPSSFSLGYILYRLRQHALPGVNVAGLLVKSLRASEISIPVWMGEIYAVFKRSGDLGEGL